MYALYLMNAPHFVVWLQIYIHHTDARNPADRYSQYCYHAYELGEWLHIGWTNYNGFTTCYIDGCLKMKHSNKAPYIHFQPNGGIRFGPETDINIALNYDEVYLWDREKDASVFNTIYAMDV